MTQGLNDSGTPSLTVAIPTCNGRAHLAEALHSILNQECPPFDLLVSDDHSDDETVALVREIAGERAQIVVNEHRLGLAGNWNQCMALSRTPWVSIFHQDDVMLPGHLAWAVREIENIEETKAPVGLIAVPTQVIDERSAVIPETVEMPQGLGVIPWPHVESMRFAPGEVCGWLRVGNALRCSAVITGRQAYADVGGFDPSYRYVVDWDFWYRVARKWQVAWRVEPATVQIRRHTGSETHRFKTGTDDLDEIARFLTSLYEHEYQSPPKPVRDRLQANRNLSRAYLNRSHEALRSGQIELARRCLARAWSISSSKVLRTVATDPRLCAQMAMLAMAPGLAGRWFGRR
jgi:glycosyltransferase involved in cell wall biosynthesis